MSNQETQNNTPHIEFHYNSFDTDTDQKIKQNILLPHEGDFEEDLKPCFEVNHITLDKIDVVFDMKSSHDKLFTCEVHLISKGEMIYKSSNEGDNHLDTAHYSLKEAVAYVHKLKEKKVDTNR